MNAVVSGVEMHKAPLFRGALLLFSNPVRLELGC